MPLRASPSGSVPWRRCLRAGAGARAAPPRCGWAAPGLPPCARTIRCRCGCSSDRRRCCWPSSRPRGAAGTGGRAVGGRHPLAALAVPARAGTHLLLRVLLPPRADRRAQRAERLVARGRVPARSRGAMPRWEAIWAVPTLLWLGNGTLALKALIWCGLASSILLTANVWPRLTCALCTLFFLSFVSAAQDFSSYQSDGMLLEAGFISTFFAPAGPRPGLGERDPPSRLSWFL